MERNEYERLISTRLTTKPVEFDRLNKVIKTLSNSDLKCLYEYSTELDSGFDITEIKRTGLNLDVTVVGGRTWIGV